MPAVMAPYVARVLPEGEWPRLRESGCELAQALKPAALNGSVLIVEREGQILGSLLVMTCAVADGLWLHPSVRDTAPVGRALFKALPCAVEAFGAQAVLIPAAGPVVAEWVTARLGGSALTGQAVLLPMAPLERERF